MAQHEHLDLRRHVNGDNLGCLEKTRRIRASLVRSICGGPQDQRGEQERNLQQAHHKIITCTPQRTRAIFTLTTRASTSSYSKRLSARSPLSDFASAVVR